MYINKSIELVDTQMDLTKCLLQAENCPLKQSANIPKLQWTGKIRELVELVYALYEAKCFNNGKMFRHEVFAAIGEMFGVDLKDFAAYLGGIKNRKDRTRFLDKLKQELMLIFEKSDEKPSRK